MKKAFTLAEVLVTLGIVGVVSALTIPTLVQNYREREFEAKAKKSYSTLSQAFEELLRKQNAVTLSETSFINNPEGALTTVLSVVDVPSAYTIPNSSRQFGDSAKSIIQLADGTIVAFSTPVASSSKTAVISQIEVDTNGKKLPNVYGRDIFVFYVDNTGTVISGSQGGSFDNLNDAANKTQQIMNNGWEISN